MLTHAETLISFSHYVQQDFDEKVANLAKMVAFSKMLRPTVTIDEHKNPDDDDQKRVCEGF